MLLKIGEYQCMMNNFLFIPTWPSLMSKWLVLMPFLCGSRLISSEVVARELDVSIGSTVTIVVVLKYGKLCE